MIPSIKHAVNLMYSIVREHYKSHIDRPSYWANLSKSTKFTTNRCAACGTTKQLQVHHIIPYNLRPDLDKVPKNLVVLCMDKKQCHLRIGHGNSWSTYNPNVAADLLNIASGSITHTDAINVAKKNAKLLPINIHN